MDRITLIFLLLLPFAVLGQRNPEEYFPKTPEAASLSKFIDIPPGNYTGTAGFTIPLYEIDFEGHKMPVDVSYHASGIKLAEVASRVGLGWALNTGPSLSVQVIGGRDSYSRYEIPENFDPVQLINPDHYFIATQILGVFSPESAVDARPDIYSYSTLSSQGNFIFDSGGAFGIPRPFNQDKITRSGNHIQIIDEYGFIYSFHFEGGSSSPSSCAGAFGVLGDSNYRISKIEAPNGKSIDFVYDISLTAGVQYMTSITQNKHIRDVVSLSSPSDFPLEFPPLRCYNSKQLSERMLKKIVFPDGEVEFFYNHKVNEVRQDLPGDYFLKRVTIKNKSGQEIKDFSFTQDYFTTGDMPVLSPSYFQYLMAGTNKRLRLKKITDNKIERDYEFSYYDGHELPNRMSFSYDYWGVYNGKNNSTSIDRSVYPETIGGTNPLRLYSVGANKNPDFQYGVTGNLKEIKYPTGGSTLITYEADDYVKAPYAPFPYDYELIPVVDITTSIGNLPETFLDFTVENQAYEFNVDFYSEERPKTGSNIPHTEGECTLKFYKFTETQPFIELNQYYPQGDIQELKNSFEPGDYKMVLTRGYDALTSPYHCIASISRYEQLLLNGSDVQKAGTLRVKKIEKIEEGDTIIRREFTYINPNDSVSSGKNIGDQYFTSIVTQEFPINIHGGKIRRMYLSANPGWNLSTAGGKAIGYSYVQEHYTHVETHEKYRKEYEFENESDGSANNINPFAFFNFTFPIEGLGRGRLLGEKQYDSDNTLKLKKEYQYHEDHYFNKVSTTQPTNPSTVIMRSVELYVHKITEMAPGTNIPVYHFSEGFNPTSGVFDVNNFWLQPTQVKTTEYFGQGGYLETIENTSYSPYPNPKHTFPTLHFTVNSKGETEKTAYQYPQDLVGVEQSPHMQNLVTANRVAAPVVTRSFRVVGSSEDKLSETHIKYGQNTNTSGLLLPVEQHIKKGEGNININTIEDRKITYVRYDSNGNLLEYKVEDGTPVSIIWGYNQQYPIAKIEGVTYSQVSGYAGNLQNASNGGTLTDISFNSLRNALPATALLTCYIYKPLVGVTQIIFPNKQKHTYEYDVAGRLMKVKDHENKVVQKNDYHYKN